MRVYRTVCVCVYACVPQNPCALPKDPKSPHRRRPGLLAQPHVPIPDFGVRRPALAADIDIACFGADGDVVGGHHSGVGTEVLCVALEQAQVQGWEGTGVEEVCGLSV